jgi:hypothetical protein
LFFNDSIKEKSSTKWKTLIMKELEKKKGKKIKKKKSKVNEPIYIISCRRNPKS